MTKIRIRRKEVMNHLPKEVRVGAKMKLGSIYVGRQPLKGVEGAEEKKLLNGLLDVGPDHVEWPKHVKAFWAELSVNVPFEGVELDISTSEDGTPYNLMDYLKYKWMLKHKHVALTKEEMEKDFTKRFYIVDPQRETKMKNKEIQVRKDADKEFIKASSDVKTMKRILRLMSNKENPDRLTDEQLENLLYTYKEQNPKKFVKIAKDKNLEMKSEIEEFISASILRKIGNQVIYLDEVIGDTTEDAVVYLKDKKNSGVLTTLRAKLKEATI